MKRLLVILTLILFVAVPAVFAEGPLNPPETRWTNPTTNTDGSDYVDPGGIKMYIGTVTTGPYTFAMDISDTTLTVISASMSSLDLPDGQYYLVLTAYDTIGNESDNSNVLAFDWNKSRPNPLVIMFP